MPTPKIEIGSHTSLADAMEEWKRLTEENANLVRQLNEVTGLCNKMTAENIALKDQHKTQDAFYRSQIETLSDHRDRLQRGSVALLTRLRGIKEAIVAAEADANHQAITPNPDGENGGLEKAIAETVHSGSLGGGEVKNLISNLPHNEMS